jgi:hypothetical protein
MREPTSAPRSAIWSGAGPRAVEVVMDNVNSLLEPGQLVRNPDRPDWGLGQVQSNIGGKVTVNFENEGKLVLDGSQVVLVPVYD